MSPSSYYPLDQQEWERRTLTAQRGWSPIGGVYEMQRPNRWPSHQESWNRPPAPSPTAYSPWLGSPPPSGQYSRESLHSIESAASGSAPLLQRRHATPTPGHPPSIHHSKNWRQEHLSGWKAGVAACSAMATLVLLTNLSLTIWASRKYGVDKDRIGTISGRSCSETKRLSLWLHLAINVLSSVLLSASNYCMQVLSSPTRDEVDRQHLKGSWLDIGLPSVRNLRGIKSSRVILWCCLGLSSIPLHLLYNSAVFSTLAANEYYALVVAPEFLENAPWNLTGFPSDISAFNVLNILSNATANRLDRLDRATCITQYGGFVSARSNVIIVTTNHSSTNSLFWAQKTSNFSTDVCMTIRGCRVSLSPDATVTSLGDIDHCLSQKVEEKCKLQFSLYIMIVVIFCNLVKSISMLLTFWKRYTQPLVTLGDAVSSFLDDPDATTEGMCLVSKSDVLGGAWRTRGTPKQYQPVQNFWFRAASLKRWLICNCLCFGTLVATGVLLKIGIDGLSLTTGISLKILYDMGLGAVTSSSILSIGMDGMGAGPLLANVLLANSPQALLSFLYLTYNGIFTCMLSADEWGRFTRQRKTLRVTSPVDNQRSNYYLQLPYTWALPLLVMSGTLHWLVSQSIFLARVAFYDENGQYDPNASFSTCGYSCIAIILVIIIGSIVVLGGIGFGFRKYPAGIPLAAGCSAAISAACHPPPREDEDVSKLPLRWGTVSVGHCSFSAGPVEYPVSGYLYAGVDNTSRE